MTHPFKIGSHVKVNLADGSEWNRDAFKALNGATGVVVEILEGLDPWGRVRDPLLTVDFDVALKPWWPGQLPVIGYRFALNELEIVE